MEKHDIQNNIGKPQNVDFYIYESDMARAERHVRRWMVACIVLFLALAISNGAWIWYENQFEDITTTVTQETSSKGGGDAIIHGDHAGAVINGESETDSNN